MSLYIRYKIKDNKLPSEGAVKACDNSAKAVRSLLGASSRGIIGTIYLNIASRFYRRTIKPGLIEYEFYLIGKKGTK